MKKFLRWFLAVVITGLTALGIFFFVFIKNACIPSWCGPEVESASTSILSGDGQICSQDCGGVRSYLLVWVIAIITAMLLVWWVYLLKEKRKSE